MVLAEEFPNKYSKAIYFQYSIGWYNFFCGKFFEEWLIIYDESQNNSNNNQQFCAQYIWGANIIKIMLQNMISLWDIHNQQVNGNTDRKQQRIMKECQIP